MDKMTHDDFNTGSQVWNEYCMLDPRLQVGSSIFIMDFSGVGKDKFFKMFDQKASKLGTKYFQVLELNIFLCMVNLV